MVAPLMINEPQAMPGEEEVIEINLACLPCHSPVHLGITVAKATGKTTQYNLIYEDRGASHLDELLTQIEIDCVLKMKYQGVGNTPPAPVHETSYIYHSQRVGAKSSGMFYPFHQPGEKARKNRLLSYTSDLFGSQKPKEKSLVNGFIIGLNSNPIVRQGNAIMHFSVKE